MQAVARSKKQQGVAYLQALIREVRADGFAFAPDAGKFDAIAFPKVEFTDGPAGKCAARIERGIHQC